MQEVERGMMDAKEREKALFIEMRKEKTSKMMKQKARVKVSCTKEELQEMIQSLRRMRTSAFDYFFWGRGDCVSCMGCVLFVVVAGATYRLHLIIFFGGGGIA